MNALAPPRRGGTSPAFRAPPVTSAISPNDSPGPSVATIARHPLGPRTKRHHLTDTAGIPVAVALTAANRPDKEALAELLDARMVRAPANTAQHLCLDKGYDYADAEHAVRRRRYVPHIRRRGEERRACRRGTRSRRWVVERTTSWFNRCRKLLIRWEKKPENYLALVHFAAAIVVWRGLVG
jgi:putative transposase